MWKLLLVAALSTGNSLDQVLEQLDSAPVEVRLQVRLVPSSQDPDVLWMTPDLSPKNRAEKHWIPPLRLGITERTLEEWPAQEVGDNWSDRLERTYYLPVAQRFARQQIPFHILLQVEAARSGDSCTLQAQLTTTVVSDASAIEAATVRDRTRQVEGQVLMGQSLVISNLYPFEEVLPVLGEMPVLGPLFQPSTTGPMVIITPQSDRS